MRTGTLEKTSPKKEPINFLFEELGEECRRVLGLLDKLKGKKNGKGSRDDVIAELSASALHLHIHTKGLLAAIDDELDREDD